MRRQRVEFYDNQNRVVQEAFSALRINIGLADESRKIKKLAIVSYQSSEGRTAVAINLAISYAHTGIRVLFIDTDLRKPVEVKKHSTREDVNLSSVEGSAFGMEEVVRETNVRNLWYVPSGSSNPNPSGYLSGKVFQTFLDQVEEKYDMIILDTPAMGSVVDALVVASKADAVMMVVAMGGISSTKLKRAKEQLLKVNANFLGVVLNKATKSEYRKYFDIYQYYFKTMEKKSKWGKKSEETTNGSQWLGRTGKIQAKFRESTESD